MSKAIVLYLHVHQPYRIQNEYTLFDIGSNHSYFDSEPGSRTNNAEVLAKVASKSYLPMNALLLRLLQKHPEFKLSLSITGTIIEQFETYMPEVLESFKVLTATGRVDIVAETYYHSLAFFYDRTEFEAQVAAHREKVQSVFGITPKVFRNTELAYNNDLAYWADQAGYSGILAEGWDPVLDWRSPNYVYRPSHTKNIALLMKNYRLSDDLAFRFGNRAWGEWPLTIDKYISWIEASDPNSQVINLFMDYETFGEHQWADTGIFDFMEHLPEQWLGGFGRTFMTVSEAVARHKPVGEIDMPQTVTWADTERDLSAWLGNGMQQSALRALYDLKEPVLASNDLQLISDWRRLQTSDHPYYMCTKWFHDGDIHAYFSPYETPYQAYIVFMNAVHDVRARLIEKGLL